MTYTLTHCTQLKVGVYLCIVENVNNHYYRQGADCMGRFTSLTEKTYKILTKDEAYEEFDYLRDAIAETPSDYFYLKVTDHHPTPAKIPPQLIGPYPSLEEAEMSIRQATDQYRSGMSHTHSNIVEFEKVLKMKEKDDGI
jgi:hypothetical protein